MPETLDLVTEALEAAHAAAVRAKDWARARVLASELYSRQEAQKYSLEGLPNKVLATEYRTTLPQERLLVEEIEKSRSQLEKRARVTQRNQHRRKSGR